MKYLDDWVEPALKVASQTYPNVPAWARRRIRVWKLLDEYPWTHVQDWLKRREIKRLEREVFSEKDDKP